MSSEKAANDSIKKKIIQTVRRVACFAICFYKNKKICFTKQNSHCRLSFTYNQDKQQIKLIERKQPRILTLRRKIIQFVIKGSDLETD